MVLKMSLQITIMNPIFYLFVFSIQMTTAPEITEEGEIRGITANEIQTLLQDTKNLGAVQEILDLAKKDPTKAKERLQSYNKQLLSNEMKWVLGKIIEVPDKICVFLRPAVIALHKQLRKKSIAYRFFSKPVYNFLEGTGLLSLTTLGFTIRTLGEIAQLINNIVQDGTTAYNGGKESNRKAFKRIDKVAEGAKQLGDKFESDGKEGLRNMALRRQSKENNLDSAQHSSVQPPTTGSQKNSKI